MKQSDSAKAWLMSPEADELRKLYAGRAKQSANELMSIGMTSSDPKVVTHAIAYATWRAALKELDFDHDPD